MLAGRCFVSGAKKISFSFKQAEKPESCKIRSKMKLLQMVQNVCVDGCKDGGEALNCMGYEDELPYGYGHSD